MNPKSSFAGLLVSAAMAGANSTNWGLPPGMRLAGNHKPPKVYDTPSFINLMRAATTRAQMNDILETAHASNANPRTLRRLDRAYDLRLKELNLV